MYGHFDGVYAFRSSAAPKRFPYFTGREQSQMLRYRARYRHAERMMMPPNLAEAAALTPGLTPLYADPDDLMVERLNVILHWFDELRRLVSAR